MNDPLELQRRIDQICNLFEEQWQSDRLPEISNWLERIEASARSQLLPTLLEVEVELRVKAGQQVRPQDYQALGSEAVAIVDKLLHEGTSDQRRANPPTTRRHPNSTGEAASQQIGPYKLLQQIGEGGMGTVWITEQSEPVKRRVALKLIKTGVGSKEILARFEGERQALAMMNHPNIARILDAGTTADGQPYFVMELIAGIPLTKYCDDNRIGIDERLSLFTEVCSGVQHAHQKGIIHRDLKPGNILVGMLDGKPVPKIIDFGLAKAVESTQRLTDQSLFTGIGQILGTLKYMSPEQASLDAVDIDTRTDIYALGVILYELLTGSTPLDDSSIKGQAALKILEFVREKEPVKPSSRLGSSTDEQKSSITNQRRTDSVRLNRVLLGDLDWIVMKALEKDRTRRYESASGFAADIRRYLNSEPVVARPPSLNYRVRKFVRKNRVGVMAASLVILSLIGGIVGTSLAMFRAWDAEKLASDRLGEAVAAKKEETEQRQLAETRRQEAVREKEIAEQNLAYAKKGNEILGSVFANLDPDAEYRKVSDLRNVLGNNLENAVTELEGSSIGDPLTVAEMQNTLGVSLLGLGQASQAIALFERALKTQTTKLGPNHPTTLNSMNGLAMGFHAAGQLDKALPLLEQTLELRKAELGTDHPDTLTSMNNLAMGYQTTGRLDKALPLFEQTLALRKAKLGPDHADTLQCMNNLAWSYQTAGQLDKALPLMEQTLELRKTQLGPDHTDTLESMGNLASGYKMAGHHDKALPLWEQTLELMKAQFGQDHPDTLTSMNNLAECYRFTGQLDKALPLFEQTLELMKTQLGPEHPLTLTCLNNLAFCYQASGQLDKALPLSVQTLELMKTKLGPDHPDTLTSMNNLALGYRDAGQLDKALPLWEQTLELIKAKLGPDHPNTLMCMGNLADGYADAGQLDKALPLLEQSLELIKAKLGADHPETMTRMNNLALSFQDAGQLDKALPLLKETLELTKARLGPNHPLTLTAMSNLGAALWRARKLEESVPIFEEVTKIREKKLGRGHPDTQETIANLGVNYKDAGRFDEAIPLLEEAWKASQKIPSLRWVGSQLRDAYLKAKWVDEFLDFVDKQLADASKSLGKDSIELAGILATLGTDCLSIGSPRKAEEFLRECLRIRQANQPELWSTFNTRSSLGGALLAQSAESADEDQKAKFLAEAEPLLLAGYEGMKQREASIPPQAATRIPEALDRLIKLYETLNKPDEVAKYRKLREGDPDDSATSDK